MRKKLHLLLSGLLCISVSLQAQKPLIQNVGVRKSLSLDGEWNTLIDHSVRQYQGDGHFDGTRLSDYDFEDSPTLRVPGDWNTQRPELFYYESRVWYRKKLCVTPAEGKRYFLHFGAANYKAAVYLNGNLLGSHEGGFTPFEFEVTGQLRAENSVVVKVEANHNKDGIPVGYMDWFNYGGLTRSVSLIEMDATFIQDYSVQLSCTDNKTIEGYIQLSDSMADGVVTLQIPELKLKKQLKTDAAGHAVFSFKAKPQLWSPESPKLYDVQLAFGSDVICDQIGFRTIKTEGSRILLNGKEVFLAGVNFHEESISQDGGHRCTGVEDDSVLLTEAKELGCNFVRLAHYPHNEDMIRLADRMGIMVWSEIPLWQNINYDNPSTCALAEQYLHEMVSRDHNRCSVIIWSLSNESIRENPTRTPYLTSLAAKARQLDSTRLIGSAMSNATRIDDKHYTFDDPLVDALDLISFNQYFGWYEASIEGCDSITWHFDVNKPVIISEFGGGAKHFTEQDSPRTAAAKSVARNPKAFFNEDNQAEIYRHQFTMLWKMPQLAGTTPWVMKDFRSPFRMLPGVQDGYNRKGLVTERGERKKAWYIVKEWNEAHRHK